MPLATSPDLNGKLDRMPPVGGWSHWRVRTPRRAYRDLDGRSNRRDPREVGQYETGTASPGPKKLLTSWNVERNLPKPGGRRMHRHVMTRRFGWDHRRIYDWNVPYQALDYALDPPKVWTTRVGTKVPEARSRSGREAALPQPTADQGQELFEMYGMGGMGQAGDIGEDVEKVSQVVSRFISTGDLQTQSLLEAGIDFAAKEYLRKKQEEAREEAVELAEREAAAARAKAEAELLRKRAEGTLDKGLPGWVLPAGIAAAAFFLLSGGAK